jgi:transcriptional regulator with XRE-family HTH domain
MSPSLVVTFGDLLKQARKRAGMTQADLAAAVGYSVPFISNLELNQRLPDVQAVVHHFVPALGLQEEPHLAARLVELAAAARGERPPAALTLKRETHLVLQEERAARPASWPSPPTELIGRQQEVKTLCNRLLGHNGRLWCESIII